MSLGRKHLAYLIEMWTFIELRTVHQKRFAHCQKNRKIFPIGAGSRYAEVYGGGLLVSWFLGFVVSWIRGVVASWFLVCLVSCFLDVLGSQCLGVLASWFLGFKASWFQRIKDLVSLHFIFNRDSKENIERTTGNII